MWTGGRHIHYTDTRKNVHRFPSLRLVIPGIVAVSLGVTHSDSLCLCVVVTGTVVKHQPPTFIGTTNGNGDEGIMVSVRDWSTRYCSTAGSDRCFSTAVRFGINF